MPGSKPRQDGISTTRKKWAIKDQPAPAPTDGRSGHWGGSPNGSAFYQPPDIDGKPKGVDFSAAQVNELDLASDVNFSAY